MGQVRFRGMGSNKNAANQLKQELSRAETLLNWYKTESHKKLQLTNFNKFLIKYHKDREL